MNVSAVTSAFVLGLAAIVCATVGLCLHDLDQTGFLSLVGSIVGAGVVGGGVHAATSSGS